MCCYIGSVCVCAAILVGCVCCYIGSVWWCVCGDVCAAILVGCVW